ncbi:MAG TPA: leucyl/phenylalanyl-tRNA--protein transferase [Dongiaceae bacterium]|nr:leucyl/phenylalanyl-tRNA--protein transferase [Dongiaceae bacterium]
MLKIPVLDYHIRDFPPIEQALAEPNGLLAAGGDLSPERLLQAYTLGIFPWFDDEQPILWWSPDPRAVLFPDQLHVSRSLHKTLRSGRFRVSADTAFDAVVTACAEPRRNSSGTWITDRIRDAYGALHRLGHAHSVECWHEDKLVGGIYGIALGSLFFGESMFSRMTDASKVAFVHLVGHLQQSHCPLIDCQIMNPHLATLGATLIPRTHFKTYLQRFVPPLQEIQKAPAGPWQLAWHYSGR